MESPLVQKLPMEVLDGIISYLEPIDQQCLRITCHAFKSIIPEKHFVPRRCVTFLSQRRSSANKAFISFFHRLQKPGNILHGSTKALCTFCCRLLLSGCFTFASLTIDDLSVCDDCIFDILLTFKNRNFGHKLTYNSPASPLARVYYGCISCGEFCGQPCMNDAHRAMVQGTLESYETLCEFCCDTCRGDGYESSDDDEN